MSQWNPHAYGDQGQQGGAPYQAQAETYVAYAPPPSSRQYQPVPSQQGHGPQSGYQGGAPRSGPQDYFRGGAGAEEIQTVFISGFPSDTKERELVNLLRFLPGYEVRLLPGGGGWRRLRAGCPWCGEWRKKLVGGAREALPTPAATG